MARPYKGVFPVVPTTFTESGELDLESQKRCVDFMIDAGSTGLAILATLRATLGSLDRVKRVVKVLGMVNCVPEFEQHPAVINGCSELFRDVWGADHGVGARSAVGMGSLPGDITTVIEVIFEITP